MKPAHVLAGVAQLVEQLICNQQVGGSIPFASSYRQKGEVPEWTKGTDCKSVALGLRRFESSPPQGTGCPADRPLPLGAVKKRVWLLRGGTQAPVKGNAGIAQR